MGKSSIRHEAPYKGEYRDRKWVVTIAEARSWLTDSVDVPQFETCFSSSRSSIIRKKREPSSSDFLRNVNLLKISAAQLDIPRR